MLQAVNVKKSYDTVDVLRGVTVEIGDAEVVSIVGASGAGKSTLLHILGTLDLPDSGDVLFDGKSVRKMKAAELARFRNRNLGFIFQFHNLLPEFTALENVMLPGLLAGKNEKQVKDRAIDLLSLLGLSHRLHHKPSEMSGGEQQRTSVSRSLINSPRIIFADEPSGNLDSKNARELHDVFFRLRDEMKQTFVIVTHNDELAALADRRIVMHDGVLAT